ncbi:MAG TPA: hypothetical protein VJM11_10695 [Nevskiaceae bacterium]|nr:hypothetical protein [Nevskiaceae bacterium]
MRTLAQRPGIALALLALAGCGGNGEGLDENGRPIGEGGGGPLVPEFQSIQDNVFTPICTRCHAGASAPEGMSLEDGRAYAALVGVHSNEVPSLFRVAPGDPDNSYLVHKISGTQAVGERMPLDLPPLPDTTIAVIRQWITDGAAPPAKVTLAELQARVFTPFCAPCHDGSDPDFLPGSMDLSSEAATFAAIVGVPSEERPSLDRIEPGNPDDSYLVRKVEGGPRIEGERMPFGCPVDQACLDAATIERLRTWVLDGAPENGEAP